MQKQKRDFDLAFFMKTADGAQWEGVDCYVF